MAGGGWGEPGVDPGDPGSGWMGSTRNGIPRLGERADGRAGRSPRAGNAAGEVGQGRAEMREPTGGKCAGQAGGSEGQL